MADRLSSELRMRVWLAEDPMTCVVRGASAILQDLEANRKFLVSLDRPTV
jgi:rod shape-determining protein MreB